MFHQVTHRSWSPLVCIVVVFHAGSRASSGDEPRYPSLLADECEWPLLFSLLIPCIRVLLSLAFLPPSSGKKLSTVFGIEGMSSGWYWLSVVDCRSQLGDGISSRHFVFFLGERETLGVYCFRLELTHYQCQPESWAIVSSSLAILCSSNSYSSTCSSVISAWW